MDVFVAAANYGVAAAISLYMVYWLTRKLNGKIDRLTESINRLDKSINKLIEKMEGERYAGYR